MDHEGGQGSASPDGVAGLVLAAGAGTRYGGAKALARDERGPWLPRAVDTLRAGGCASVTVVLGAEAARASALLPDPAVRTVVAEDWEAGLSHSLRAGLESLLARDAPARAVAITLVDLPGLSAEAVRRVIADATPASLRRAVYTGAPGHPVLIGRAHWRAVLEELDGDRGAGPYLRRHGVEERDCTELGGGHDVDERPVDARPAEGRHTEKRAE